jgi:hypothetical protein
MHARSATAIAIAIASVATAETMQRATATDEVVERATAYVAAFVARFSTVVAEERYVQESAALPRVNGSGVNKTFDQPIPIRRTLKSDFLLVRRDVGTEWNTFRDVYEVDGRPVRDRGERLTRLLARPTADSTEEARRIAFEGARYNLGGAGRTIDNPLTVLAILQPHLQHRFRFTAGKPDKSFPATVLVVEYKEQARPTILNYANAQVPMTGRLWIESDTGRILQTELVVAGNDLVTTMFRFDERFQIAVPIEMRASFSVGRTAIEGRAEYGQFRRFGVTTDEQLQKVP